jgi:two-component system, response regulator / RNA-binding antiterminator
LGCLLVKILLVDDGDRHLSPLREALEASGHHIELEIHSAQSLLSRVDRSRPDVILIDTDSPSRDVLEQLCVLTSHNPLPMVMFSNDGSSQSITAATDAGVTAYIVQGIDPQRLGPILEVAQVRFRHEQKIREQMETAGQRARERRSIDTAKGMLMAAHDLSENDAYRRLQQASMHSGLPMWQVAEKLIKS